MGFRSVSALADQNIIKKGGRLQNGGGLHNDDCAEAVGSLSGAFLHGGGQKWMNNDHASFELEAFVGAD